MLLDQKIAITFDEPKELLMLIALNLATLPDEVLKSNPELTASGITLDDVTRFQAELFKLAHEVGLVDGNGTLISFSSEPKPH